MLGALLGVPLGTANDLSYSMLAMLAIFLLSGTSITYYYWKQNKRMKAAVPTAAA